MLSRIGKVIGIVLLFGASGAWTFDIAEKIDAPRVIGLAVGPAFFALLCGALVIRNRSAALAVPAIILTWYLAVLAAVWSWTVSRWYAYHFPSIIFGGMIGGVGVAASVSVALPRLRRTSVLAGGALAGLAAAIPFGLWFQEPNFYSDPAPNRLDPTYIRCALAIWQGIVGAYLYIVSRVSETNDLR